MPVIKLNDQQFLLRPGTNRLGGGDLVEMTISPDVTLGVQAIVEVTGTEGVVIRPAQNKDALVLVNGVPLTDPTPLLHGDKLEIAGQELSFSDDSKTGATTFVSRAEIAAVTAAPAPAKPGEPIPLGATVRGPMSTPAKESDAVVGSPIASGGRLVSLVDGREYSVPASGLTIGRESGADVVLSHKQVSRRHAMITPTLRGYELKDLSSNGVYVNGTKINGSQVLARADMIRIAKDEFRFYADVSSLAPTRSFQSFAAKQPAPAASPAPRRAPTAAQPISSRLASQERQRGTPHTPAPASSVVVHQRAGRFAWMWGIVLLLLATAAYYMLTK
jgi:pSer/pThr/pTyr-binding forkhead associated (FHA) protein